MQSMLLSSFSYKLKLGSLSVLGLLSAWYIHYNIEHSLARLWSAFETHINLFSFPVVLTYLSPTYSVIAMAFWYGRWFQWPLLDGDVISGSFYVSPKAKVEKAIMRHGKRILLVSCYVGGKMYSSNMLLSRQKNIKKNQARC